MWSGGLEQYCSHSDRKLVWDLAPSGAITQPSTVMWSGGEPQYSQHSPQHSNIRPPLNSGQKSASQTWLKVAQCQIWEWWCWHQTLHDFPILTVGKNNIPAGRLVPGGGHTVCMPSFSDNILRTIHNTLSGDLNWWAEQYELWCLRFAPVHIGNLVWNRIPGVVVSKSTVWRVLVFIL